MTLSAEPQPWLNTHQETQTLISQAQKPRVPSLKSLYPSDRIRAISFAWSLLFFNLIFQVIISTSQKKEGFPCIIVFLFWVTHTHTHTLVGFYGLRGLSIGVMVFILYKLYVLSYTYPTPKLSPLRRLHFYLPPPQKTHSVLFISISNYWDTENVLINHILLVVPVSYLCHYTNVWPHKLHKHIHTHTHTHTHTQHVFLINALLHPPVLIMSLFFHIEILSANGKHFLPQWKTGGGVF